MDIRSYFSKVREDLATPAYGQLADYVLEKPEYLSQYELKLRTSCAAGEPLNPDVIDQWEKGTGIRIRDGYGQTETTGLAGNLTGQSLKTRIDGEGDVHV